MKNVGRLGLGAVVLWAACLSGAGGCGETQTRPTRENTPPTADLQLPASAVAGEPIVLDASGSSDTDGAIVSYQFAPGDRDEVLITSEPELVYTYAQQGNYTVAVTVVDDRDGEDTVAATVTVVGSSGSSDTGGDMGGDADPDLDGLDAGTADNGTGDGSSDADN